MTLKEAIKWIEEGECVEEYGSEHTNGFYEALEVLLKNAKSKHKKEKYKEELEDWICVDGYSSVDLEIGNFEKLLNKYKLLEEKVRIKARKNKIVIERIK